MDVTMKSYSLQNRYPMRCGAGALDLPFPNLLTTAPVLSAVLDTTIPTPEYGIRSPLVSTLFSLCGTRPHGGC
jgi:hypothetical protein